MGRFKIGDVVINRWAAVRNPSRKTIYFGDGYFVYYYKGRFHKTTFITPQQDTEHFIIVGHEPIVELFKEMMDKYPVLEE